MIGLIMQKPITGRSLSSITVWGRHRHSQASQAWAGLTTLGKSSPLVQR